MTGAGARGIDAVFVRSAASVADFPADSLPRVVFAGRSNVGKSSVINRLAGRDAAFVGKTPGKTVHINFFLCDRKYYIVDLPGYGYAKVSKEMRRDWGRLIESYFATPGAASFGVLIVDARHPPTADDVTMFRYFKDTGASFAVAANKLDKLKKSEAEGAVEIIKNALGHRDVIPFSAADGTGRDILYKLIMEAVK